MKRFLTAYGRFVSSKPWVALGLIAALTVVAMYGFTITAEQAAPEESFLPSGSELIGAQEALEESFPQSSALETIQVVLRGDILTPGGIADSIAANVAAATDPDLEPFVVAAQPPISIGDLVVQMVAGPQGDPTAVDIDAITQADIDTALVNPDNALLNDALQELVARDESGEVVGGIGVVTINGSADVQTVLDAQVSADDSVKAVELTTLESARTFSTGKLTADSEDNSAFGILMMVAFLVIAGLLVVFYRQGSDVALSLAGLMLTITWALGFQGVLGPDGLGVIGAPSVMAQMVPIILIGLCVDYGIQVTSRYREECVDGRGSTEAMSSAVSHVMLPLVLAGGTTIISFFTNVFGDIEGMADFGVVAGVGVFSGLVVFLTGVPAGRVLLDRRRQGNGRALPTRSMNEGIPGAGRVVEAISSISVRRPAAILLIAGVFTVVMGIFALEVESGFNNEDFVSSSSESSQDIAFLGDFLGGNTEPVTVLIEADITSDRTLRNMLDLSNGLEDPVRKPDAVASAVTQSLGTVFEGLSPEALLALDALDVGTDNPLVLPSSVIQEAYEIVQADDPEGFAQVVSFGEGDTPDRTTVQFSAFAQDATATEALIDDIEGLWLGDDAQVTTLSSSIIGLEITNSLTSSQGTSIGLTVLAALLVLLVFFAATEFKPMLAVLSVLPIGLVLLWVLGTMTILGYSYNVITAMITALSIGIGVDYTIHITHRFLEEREHGSLSLAGALSKVMRTTGGALIGSALTTALGFLVLWLAPIPPMGQFGMLTALTVVYSLIVAVVVLPPMLVIWAAYHDWRLDNLTALELAQAEQAGLPVPEEMKRRASRGVER